MNIDNSEDYKDRRAILESRTVAFAAAVRVLQGTTSNICHLREQITQLANEWKVSPAQVDKLFGLDK